MLIGYRTISITFPFSKNHRSCVHEQITAYAGDRGILKPLQFGFLSLCILMNQLNTKSATNRAHGVVLLDLSKTSGSSSSEKPPIVEVFAFSYTNGAKFCNRLPAVLYKNRFFQRLEPFLLSVFSRRLLPSIEYYVLMLQQW